MNHRIKAIILEMLALVLAIAVLALKLTGGESFDVARRILSAACVVCVFLWWYFFFGQRKKVILEIPKEPRAIVLRRFCEYDIDRKENYSFQFELGGRLPALLEKYGYQECINDVDPQGDELCFALFHFVCTNFHHDGGASFHHGKRLKDIIEACEANGQKTNCRGLSMMLAALLRAHNVKARHVTCMPYEEPFGDCHVVVDCVLPSGKRIMFDPTQHAYFTEKSGEYVSLRRLRELLIAGEVFFENKEASYNGAPFDKAHYVEYMCKNTLRFSANLRYADVKDEKALGAVELVPKDYPVGEFKGRNNFVFNPDRFWKII